MYISLQRCRAPPPAPPPAAAAGGGGGDAGCEHPPADWVQTVTSSGRFPALLSMCSTSSFPSLPGPVPGVFGATLTAVSQHTDDDDCDGVSWRTIRRVLTMTEEL